MGRDSNKAVFPALAAVFAIGMLGTTLPTPLYPLYQDQFGFSQLVITVIYACYAGGVIAALIVTGTWSDQIGRRPLLALGLLFAALSAVAFIVSDALAPLLVGRVLSGISAGIFTGTATVAVIEAAPPRHQAKATVVATAANMGGLGLGPLLAGLLGEYVPAPLVLPYAVNLVLIGLAFLIITRIPETAVRPARARLSMRLPGLPAQVRAVFLPAAIASFAGFAVLGMFSAVTPAILRELLHQPNLAVTGLVVFAMFIASTLGQMVQARLPLPARVSGGCLVLIIGAGLVITAITAASLVALVASVLCAGCGQGMVFAAGLGEIARASPPDRRAEVASSFFVVAYLAISLPVVGLGLLVQILDLATAGIVFSLIVAGLALLAMFMLRRGTAPTAP